MIPTVREAAPVPLTLPFIRLPHALGLPDPVYQTADAAGVDLAAAIPDDEPLTLAPMARVMVPTGLILEIPKGHEGQVRSRSGLAAKAGVTVLNSPGTIDADYRGEVKVILINFGAEPFTIRRGERIAQLVIAPVTQVTFAAIETVNETLRGAGGFGSTGR